MERVHRKIARKLTVACRYGEGTSFEKATREMLWLPVTISDMVRMASEPTYFFEYPFSRTTIAARHPRLYSNIIDTVGILVHHPVESREH